MSGDDTTEKTADKAPTSSNVQQQQPQQQQNNNVIGAIDNSKVKLPDFTEEFTELLFWQVECAFEAANIGADRKKYNTIIGQLPTRVMYKLADLRQNPPENGTMYQTLKQRLITEFGDSTQTKITKLFSEMTLVLKCAQKQPTRQSQKNCCFHSGNEVYQSKYEQISHQILH